MKPTKRILSALLCCTLLAGPTAFAADTAAASPDPMADYAQEYGHMLGLTPAQRLEDYEFFWKTLRESYPYYSLLERQGFDMDVIYQEYRDMIANYDNDTDLYAAINSICYRFGGTGHLMLIDAATRDYLTPLYEQTAGRKTWADTLTNPVSAKQYPKIAAFESYTAADDGTSNVSQSTQTKLDNVTTLHLNDQTAYLRISSFAYENISADQKKISDFYDALDGCKNLIIDITGNGGGSDNYWQDLLVAPLISKPLSATHYLLMQNTANNQPYLSEALGSSALQPISKLPKLDALQDRDRMTHFIADTVTVQPAKKHTAFSGKIWLLVDEGVYSSSEALAAFSKSTGFATLVGTQTGGDGLGMDPVFMVLPNSGLIVRYSALYGLNPDGSCNEEFGTTPDIISQNEAPLTTALREILKN